MDTAAAIFENTICHRYVITPLAVNLLSLFVLCEAKFILRCSAQTLLTSAVSPTCLVYSPILSFYTMSYNYLFMSNLLIRL